MGNFESQYRSIWAVLAAIFFLSIFLSNSGLETDWLWRWGGVAVTYVGLWLLSTFGFFFVLYKVFICKEDWSTISFVLDGRKRTKVEKYIAWFFLFVIIPIAIIFASSFSYLLIKDTFTSLVHKDNSLEKTITVWEQDTPMGIWFLAQIISTEEGDGLTLPFSLKSIGGSHRKYHVRYLPNSEMIIDFEKIPRMEDEISIITEISKFPSESVVTELENALRARLEKDGVGYVVRSIHPLWNRGDRDIFGSDGVNLRSIYKPNGGARLVIKSPDADRTYQAILPVLERYSFLKESKVEIRYRDENREDKFGFTALTLE